MIIEQITIKGFLSYKKKQIIDFPQTPVCLVNGSINSDTSLSNGSGKSSLFEAIPVNLFGKIGGRAEVLDAYINDEMDELFISLIFKIDNVRFKSVFSRERGASTKHEIFFDSENKKIEDSKWKKTDKLVEEILGLSFSTYNSTIYLNERDSLKFIDGASSDRKEILRELLNAKVFDIAAKKVDKKITEIEREIDLSLNLIKNKQEQIQDEEQIKKRVKELKNIIEQLKIENEKLKKKQEKIEKEKKEIELEIGKQNEIEKQIESEKENSSFLTEQQQIKNTKLEKLNNQLRQAQIELKKNKELLKNIEQEKKQIRELISGKKELEIKIKEIIKKVEKSSLELREKEKVLVRIQSEFKQLQNLVNKLSNFESICPITNGVEEECPIKDEKYKQRFKKEKQEKLDELDSLQKKLEEEISEIEEVIEKANEKNEKLLKQMEDIQTKEKELQELESDKKNYSFKNEQYEKEIEANKENIEELERENQSLKIKIAKSKENLITLLNKINKDLKKKIEEIEEREEEIKSQIKVSNREIIDNETEIAISKEKLERIEEIKKHIDEIVQKNEQSFKNKKIMLVLSNIFGKEGIQKSMIKQVIPFLEKSSSDLLKIFNNDSEKIKIKLDLDPKRADGELKKGGGLDLLVLEEDKPPKDLRMYSGGERIRLIFSIILGLARLLSKRSGKKHETLIIDEKIAKLDRRGIDQFAEVIEIISKWYKRIFIITHIESLKDLFNQGEILVNKTDEEGSVVTINE